MDVLIQYGFSIEEIKIMMDANDRIESLPDKDIYDLIELLVQVGCDTHHIKNIFIGNPFYLSKNISDVKDLVIKLKEIGFQDLYILFDSNPYLLNILVDDLEKFYQAKISQGFQIDEIMSMIEEKIVF